MQNSFDIMSNAASTPELELGAYEYHWIQKGTTFKRIADQFDKNPNLRFLDMYDVTEAQKTYEKVKQSIEKSIGENWKYVFRWDDDYPLGLKSAEYPIGMTYYSGDLTLANEEGLCVVGTRNPSPEGVARTRKMAKLIGEHGYTIISGLAQGIDKNAHLTALENGFKTIGVIGTPIHKFYPKENADIQKEIANNHLLISQVPVLRAASQGPRGNRLFFPERNKTMSAISKGTIIIEAGETSGTLIQARAALKQGRKLFILDSCFNNPSITWPAKFLEQGAIRVREFDDILSVLQKGDLK